MLTHHPDLRGLFPAYSAHIESLAELPATLAGRPTEFVLLVAADTSDMPGPALVTLATQVLETGATYVCCWGPDSDRLHDCFDEADLYRNLDRNLDRVVMTTMHSGDTLEEAVWFALNTAYPDEGADDQTDAVILITVGNLAWSRQLSQYLDAGAPIPDEA